MRSAETKEEAIIRLYKLGYSNNKIYEQTGIRVPKIKDTIAQYNIDGTIPKSPKLGQLNY